VPCRNIFRAAFSVALDMDMVGLLD
jgi:hypothetical protein